MELTEYYPSFFLAAASLGMFGILFLARGLSGNVAKIVAFFSIPLLGLIGGFTVVSFIEEDVRDQVTEKVSEIEYIILNR